MCEREGVGEKVAKGSASEWYLKVKPSVDVSVVNIMCVCVCMCVFVCDRERVWEEYLRRVLRQSGIYIYIYVYMYIYIYMYLSICICIYIYMSL